MRLIFVTLSLLLMGCATSTLEKRKAEKRVAYQGLNQEFKTLVDQGQIKTGMTEDAVYMAWGKPSEVLTVEDENGHGIKWLYKGIYLQGSSYWTFRPDARSSFRDYYARPEGPVLERRLQQTYEPRNYVRAEVDFVNGKVTKWRKQSRPR